MKTRRDSSNKNKNPQCSSVKSVVKVAFLLLCLLFIILCRFLPVLAEGYARSVYPALSAVLSAFSSLFPFPLEEPLVILMVLRLLLYPFWKRRSGVKRILLREAEMLVWIYIWFYLGWGLNYFRYSVYARMDADPAPYEEQAFQDFLAEYADSLNASYMPDITFDREAFDRELKRFYRDLPSACGLATPRDYQVPKNFIIKSLQTGMGVLVSMGPFFAESQLNAEMPLLQLPFTYAHEFSHLLGVSNEAEANYWAYRACIHSASPAVRYSGYFGILSYVRTNASRLLSEEKYRAWVQTLRPEVVEAYEQKRAYWAARHSPVAGAVQDCLYDWFLKGNRVSSGRQNYAEVVGILLTFPVVSRYPTAPSDMLP